MAEDYTPPGERSYAQRQERNIEAIQDEEQRKEEAGESEFVEVSDDGDIEAKETSKASRSSKKNNSEDQGSQKVMEGETDSGGSVEVRTDTLGIPGEEGTQEAVIIGTSDTEQGKSNLEKVEEAAENSGNQQLAGQIQEFQDQTDTATIRPDGADKVKLTGTKKTETEKKQATNQETQETSEENPLAEKAGIPSQEQLVQDFKETANKTVETDSGVQATSLDNTFFSSIGAYEAQDVDPEENPVFDSPDVLEDNSAIQGLNKFFEDQVVEDKNTIEEAGNRANSEDDVVTPGEFLGTGASTVLRVGENFVSETGDVVGQLEDAVKGQDIQEDGFDVSELGDIDFQAAEEDGDKVSEQIQTTVNAPVATADLLFVSGPGAAFTGAATDEFNPQRSVPEFTEASVENIQESPFEVGSAVLVGGLFEGPAGTVKSSVAKSAPDDIDTVSTKVQEVASAAQKQAQKGGKDATTVRDFIQGDLPERAMTTEEIKSDFSQEDLVMGRNNPDARGSLPGKQMTRKEFLKRQGIPTGQKPEDLAGVEFGAESRADRIVQKLTGERKGQLTVQRKKPVEEDSVDVETRDTVSVGDKVDRVEEKIKDFGRIEGESRRSDDVDVDRRSPDRETEFNKPETGSGIDDDLVSGVGAGLGVGQDFEQDVGPGFDEQQGLDQEQRQDPVQEPEEDEQIDHIIDNDFGDPGDEFDPLDPERRRDPDPENERTPDRDFDNRRDRDFEGGEEEDILPDFPEEDPEEMKEGEGAEVAPSLNAVVFDIEGELDEEETFTGLETRPVDEDINPF